MNSFSPIYDRHAISEVALFFEFSKRFNKDDLTALEELKRTLAKDLPEASDILAIEMRFLNKSENLSQPQIPGKAGFELKKQTYNDDDTVKLDWMLRITDKTISVHCLEYVRWEGFRNKASDFFIKAFKKLNLSNNSFKTIVLKYIDKFIYDGDISRYDIEGLFNKPNAYIAPHVMETSDSRWHSHIGWFEPFDDNLEILNQVNIDSAHIGALLSSPHITTIDHNAILRRNQGDETPLPFPMPFEKDNEDFNSLINVLNYLHDLNKSVIGDMLSSDMKSKIHLNEN